MGHYVRTFAMFDNGEEVFRGTAIEIEKEFSDVIESRDRVYAYERLGTKLYGRYTFKDAGNRYVPNPKELPKKRSTPKHDRELEYLVTHLRIYGNTSFKNRADKYKKELEALGIRFKTRKSTILKDCYILERI